MRNPSLAEVIKASNESHAEGMHVAIPGTVVQFYPKGPTGLGTASADIKPGVKLPLRAGEGGSEVVYEELPTFPDVPISYPSGGGYMFVFALSEGDPVQLLFNDVGIAEYLTAGRTSEPLDTRRHSLGYPTATPGGARPDPKALKDTPAEGAIIGKDDAQTQIKFTPTVIEIGKDATDFVALASLVSTNLTAIALVLNSLVGPGTYTPVAVAATLAKAK